MWGDTSLKLLKIGFLAINFWSSVTDTPNNNKVFINGFAKF